jgi:hypothetical protein
MTNVTATASEGTNNYGFSNYGPSTLHNCSISGATRSISLSPDATAKVAATMLDGPTNGSGFACVGVYDASFSALDTSCN